MRYSRSPQSLSELAGLRPARSQARPRGLVGIRRQRIANSLPSSA
jgi:hypothetical protein